MPARSAPPCPFCGRWETVQRQTPDGLTIWCYSCGAQGPTSDDPGEAAADRFARAWRDWRARRDPPAAVVITPVGV